MKGFTKITGKQFEQIPKSSGVYVFNSSKEILYIGKAGNLRERVKNHFQQPTWRDNLFISQIQSISFKETSCDIDALLLESQLIKKENPKYNVIGKDGKQYFYVAISKETLPRVFLTHQPHLVSRSLYLVSSMKKEKRIQNTELIGPFVEGKPIKKVLRYLRKVFPYYTTKTHPATKCPWCHINLCPGPNPNVKAYKKSIHNLIAVLQGKRKSVLQKLQQEMHQAVSQERFEDAGVIRDQIAALERILSHTSLFAREETPLQYEKAEASLQKVFNTTQAIQRLEAYDISNIQGHQATGSMVTFLNGKPAKEWYRKFKISITGKPNDFAMMQELITRRLNHTEWPYPDLIIIDGGKGQLSAAQKALSYLPRASYPQLALGKLKKIKIAALAKKHNELFIPETKKPYLLQDMPQEAERLLLYIRDEAHRFAISYHRHLRSKTMIRNI